MHLKIGLSVAILVVLAFFILLQTGMLNILSDRQLFGMPAPIIIILLGFVFFVTACWVAGYAMADDEKNAR